MRKRRDFDNSPDPFSLGCVKKTNDKELLIYTLLWLAVLIWSSIRPYDRTTWVCEVAPVLIAWPLLLFTRKKFPLTPLLYRLIFFHGLLLMVGGKYTYARVPAGFWFRDYFGWARNPYDRLGHLVQGFVPALIAREIYLRIARFPRGGWLTFVCVCTAAFISVIYEFIEWWAALILKQGAAEFLGTQGDEWDTQWDMFLAVCGAVAALTLLSRLHDRQMKKVI